MISLFLETKYVGETRFGSIADQQRSKDNTVVITKTIFMVKPVFMPYVPKQKKLTKLQKQWKTYN